MHNTRLAGNALIFTLIIGLGMLALISVYLATTRSNVQNADERTARAQVMLDAQLIGTEQFKQAIRTLQTQADYSHSTRLITIPALRCDSGLRIFIATEGSCSEANPAPQSTVVNNTRPGTVATQLNIDGSTVAYTQANTEEIPVRLQYTAQTSEGRKQTISMDMRMVRTTAINFGRTGNTDFSIMAESLTIPDSPRVLDGQVYVRDTPVIPANSQINFADGLITASDSVRIGTQNIPVTRFAPNPLYPCDQAAANCPKFSGGLGVSQLNINSPAQPAISMTANRRNQIETAALRRGSSAKIPDDVDTIFLDHANGKDYLYLCNPVDCYVLTQSLNGTTNYQMTQYADYNFVYNTKQYANNPFMNNQYGSKLLKVPRPPENGGYYTPPEIGGASGNQAFLSTFGNILFSDRNLTVKALRPNAGAYINHPLIYTPGNITIGSSLIAAEPICDSYPTQDAGGNIIPANCQTTDKLSALYLTAGGNIYIGDSSRPINQGETRMTVNAHLAAGGTIRVADTRLDDVLLVGSMAAKTIDLTNLQFTEDPRMLRHPYAVSVFSIKPVFRMVGTGPELQE
ncbi:hypothetical protein Deipr_2460 (plasmid) [Deinococcus proteolyticus MRP]|uniref:Uncharacterized protein n=1 Tax=Deinococcus proteolyticus (strain ATCC 35074 / DSM 20540 / JCM 6276 / NBRC 101906 / NCIMB 13154 / VKM Ac-1939 / CCM 2703 / MRP) TaxID=693977 RepID=F0RQL8_DEIPM|nr:hypothetical protein [Deinococcus proteolyticus]ADY27577.1 hypothetical protein Deipr_2460 [Deinococcus proteolyticus MRP]